MKQITISLGMIKNNPVEAPCKPGWESILAARGGDAADYDEMFPLVDALDSNSLDDVLWATRCLPEYNNLWRRYAWWCASQVKHLTDDRRVHDCLDVIDRYIKGEVSEDDLEAAWAAARAAARDARDAAGAAWAARDAAGAAAWAARDAAGAAAGAAARAAARDARDAAGDAWAAQKDKLVQILNSGEWVE